MTNLTDATAMDAIGVLGSLIVAAAYFTVSSGRVRADGVPYQLVNLVGSILILASLWVRPNPGAILMEVLWSLIALGALWRIARGKSRS